LKQAGKGKPVLPGSKTAGSRGASPVTASSASTARNIVLPLFMAAWGILALINYVDHHPLHWDLILSVTLSPLLSLSFRGLLTPWLPAAAAAAVLALQLAAAASLGAAVLDWLRVRRRIPGEGILFPILLGLGVYTLLVQAAGLIGFYSAGSYAILTAVPLLAGAGRFHRLAKRQAAIPFSSVRPPLWLAIGLAAVAVTQLATLFAGFTPPHISDELNTRVGFPHWYLGNGRITFQPGNFFNAMPQFDSMLYGLPLSFGLLLGIKWIHWALGILSALGIWITLRNRTREARWTVLLIFLTIPAAWIMGGRAFNDLMVVAYAVGAIAAASGGRTMPRALLAGACVGLAASNKYTGVLAGLTLIPFFPLTRLVAAAGAALLVVSPWLARSFCWLGNPVFPYFYQTLGGLGWDAHQDWRFHKELMQGDFTTAQRLKQVWGFVWNVPIWTVNSWNDGNTGPLIFIAAPFLFTHASALEGLALLAVFLPVAYSSPGIRYILPLLPLAFPIMARGAEPLLASRRFGRPLLWGVVALTWFQALEILPTGWKHYDDPLPFILGQEKVPRYLDRMLYPDMYYPFTYSRLAPGVERNTPPGAKVLFLGGYGGAFYLPRKAIFSTLEPRPLPLTWARQSATPAALRRKFREAGITHVLINKFQSPIFFDYWKLWDWDSKNSREILVWVQFWQAYAQPRWHFWNHFELYELSSKPVRQPPPVVPGFEEESERLIMTLNRKREFGVAYSFASYLLKLFPSNPQLWLRMAECLCARGELTSARTCCANMESLAPGSPSTGLCRAELLIAQKRYQEAAAELERAASRLAFEPQVWLDLRAVYLVLGDRARAGRAAQWYNLVREYRPFR